MKSSAGMLQKFARDCMLGEADPIRHLKILGMGLYMRIYSIYSVLKTSGTKSFIVLFILIPVRMRNT